MFGDLQISFWFILAVVAVFSMVSAFAWRTLKGWAMPALRFDRISDGCEDLM